MATANMGLEVINQSDNASPDPINANFAKLDKLGLDYVTSSGKSGIWRWRRWKSGVFECWGRSTRQSLAPTLEGYSEQGYAQLTEQYPVTFSESPSLLVTARADGNPKAHVSYVENSKTTAQWYVGGLDWGKPGVDVECNIYAIGSV